MDSIKNDLYVIMILVTSEAKTNKFKLAQLSDVNRSHLASIESGILNPSIKTIAKLAAALNITAADLFSEQAKNE